MKNVTVLKTYIDPGMFAGINFGTSSGIYNQLNWAIDQSAFLALYQASPEHARCIQLKRWLWSRCGW